MGWFNNNYLWAYGSIFSLVLVSQLDQNSIILLCFIYMSKESPKILQGFGITCFGEKERFIFNPNLSLILSFTDLID